MQVRQLLCNVMRMVGRDDAAELTEDETPTEEVTRMCTAMLLLLNAVVDEISRGYFPVTAKESLTSSNGKYSFSAFNKTPNRIVAVYAEGERADWSYTPTYLECNYNAVEVEYEYTPDKFTLEDEFSYPDAIVFESLVAMGVAAEYLLVSGDISSAGMWEDRYRAELNRLIALRPVRGRVRMRRWV